MNIKFIVVIIVAFVLAVLWGFSELEQRIIIEKTERMKTDVMIMDAVIEHKQEHWKIDKKRIDEIMKDL